MKRSLSLKEYRAIDLFLFLVMLAVFEFIVVRVSTTVLFYRVSLAAAITSIVYMRWGFWGGIHAAFSGLLFCLCFGARPDQYAIYVLGNLFSLLSVPALERLGKERVRTGKFLSLLFPLSVILLMQGGRAVVSLVFGASPATAFGFFTTDALSILFTLVIVWVAGRLDGIYEDQVHYLIRVQDETEDGNEKE